MVEDVLHRVHQSSNSWSRNHRLSILFDRLHTLRGNFFRCFNCSTHSRLHRQKNCVNDHTCCILLWRCPPDDFELNPSFRCWSFLCWSWCWSNICIEYFPPTQSTTSFWAIVTQLIVIQSLYINQRLHLNGFEDQLVRALSISNYIAGTNTIKLVHINLPSPLAS
jgi:hypothetical protein